jgi:hypothetical protein
MLDGFENIEVMKKSHKKCLKKFTNKKSPQEIAVKGLDLGVPRKLTSYGCAATRDPPISSGHSCTNQQQ